MFTKKDRDKSAEILNSPYCHLPFGLQLEIVKIIEDFDKSQMKVILPKDERK